MTCDRAMSTRGGWAPSWRWPARDVRDFASLLLLEQLGPRTLQSLALVAEVVHGAPTRFDDPARFAFAHGGKDGHPFPVPLAVYDESIAVLRRALQAARLGETDKLHGFARLDALTRRIEQRLSPEADVDAAIRHERAVAPSLGGRTALDDRSARKDPQPARSALHLLALAGAPPDLKRRATRAAPDLKVGPTAAVPSSPVGQRAGAVAGPRCLNWERVSATAPGAMLHRLHLPAATVSWCSR